MLRQLFLYGNIFSGVEHTVDENSKEVIQFLQLQKKKKELEIVASKQLFSVEEIGASFNFEKHLFLVINNQQVLFKKVEVIKAKQIELIKMAFPSIKHSDFYCEVMETASASFVAICRKDYIQSIIEKYAAAGVSVIDFSLGNFAVQNLIPFIQQDSIYTSNSKILLENNLLIDIFKDKVVSTNYVINDLSVSNNELLALAGIVSYYSNREQKQTGFKEIQTELRQNYFQKRFFSLGVKATLGFLFLLLLVNFFVFSHYRSSIQQLNLELQQSSVSRNVLIALQNRVGKKSKLAANISSVASSNIAMVLNELGKSVPETVLLKTLYYQPILTSVKAEKEILVDLHKIRVGGISKSSANFTEWVTTLENKKWIKGLQIVSYGSGKTATLSFEFIITLIN